jgi:hypothetical protein
MEYPRRIKQKLGFGRFHHSDWPAGGVGWLSYGNWSAPGPPQLSLS